MKTFELSTEFVGVTAIKAKDEKDAINKFKNMTLEQIMKRTEINRCLTQCYGEDIDTYLEEAED